MSKEPLFREAAAAYAFGGKILSIAPFGSGHINDTYRVVCPDGAYILQRINGFVFHHPDAIMENMLGVTRFLAAKLAAQGGDPARGTLTVLKTADGADYYVDSSGQYWRATLHIPDTTAFETADSDEMLMKSGAAFGAFQRMLADYPADTLHETIPHFHDTPARYRQLAEAALRDEAGRLREVTAELRFVNDRKADCAVLMDLLEKDRLPLRATHNDTKMSNILFDSRTGAAVCVIDLDTVMPGSLLYDFGDAIRVGCSTAEEDEKDLSKVNFDRENFVAFTRGFMRGLGDNLTVNEEKLLPTGAILMTFECGMRFLTDYLEGDVYFKTAYPEHNLVRCRTQFKLVEEMEKSLDFMQKTVDDIYFDILKGNKQKEA